MQPVTETIKKAISQIQHDKSTPQRKLETVQEDTSYSSHGTTEEQ